ncbi:MAG: glucosaminidase domain-containing protein [Saprospiraceae bacterium]
MKNRTILVCCAMAAATFLSANTPSTTRALAISYIEKHLPLARQQSLLHGIPVSIILAQALHESKSGTSKLATEANNHFGIKAFRNWNGPRYKRKDDDYVDGQLVPSEFRKYASVEESYADLPLFLKSNPRRYGYLFSLSKDNYIGWANGLQIAGYATDSMYADRLIEKIEALELDRFDLEPTAPPTGIRFNPSAPAANPDPFPSATAPQLRPAKPQVSMSEAARQVRSNARSTASGDNHEEAASPQIPAPAPLELDAEGGDAQTPPCPWPTQRLEVMQPMPSFKSVGPRH